MHSKLGTPLAVIDTWLTLHEAISSQLGRYRSFQNKDKDVKVHDLDKRDTFCRRNSTPSKDPVSEPVMKGWTIL